MGAGCGDGENMLREKKQELMGKFGLHGKDTGSSEVQIALLTERVTGLTEHMKANVHDHHSRRGLLRMVSRRRRLLNYLKNNQFERYKNIVSTLGLRK
jgi:small subunit ribosomal protein S15